MTGFDYIALTVIGLSILLGVLRGAVREIFALASWILAFWSAKSFAVSAAMLLPNSIANEGLRFLAGFIIVFIVTLIVTSLIAMVISRLLKAVGLGPVDRVVGVLFGLARGVLIVLIGVLLAGLTSLPSQPVWRNAMLSKPFVALADSVKPWLPQKLAKHIRYDQEVATVQTNKRGVI